MRTFDIDPSRLEGEELDQWYRRTPDQIEAEREAARVRRFDEFFSLPADARHDDSDAPSTSYGGEGWQEARVPLAPPPPLTSMTPSGARVGPPEAAPGLPAGGPRGGFFDTYDAVPNPQLGPAYITGLPQPLNVVTPRFGGWFELGDGTLVKGDEVERVHAEQQQRMRGEVDREPPAQAPPPIAFETGPSPGQISSRRTSASWTQPATPLGDGSANRVSKRSRSGVSVIRPRSRVRVLSRRGLMTKRDAKRVHLAAGLFEWHVAEPGAVPFFDKALDPYPSLGLRQTPAR